MSREADEVGAERVAHSGLQALLKVDPHLADVAVVTVAHPARVVVFVIGELVEIKLRDRADDEGILVDQALAGILGDSVTVLDYIDAAVERIPDRFVADTVGTDTQFVEVCLGDQGLDFLKAVRGNLDVRVA